MNRCASFCKKYVIFQKVFRLFTPQIRHVWISFNSQNDQWSDAHLFVKNMKICMRPWIRRYMHPPMSQTHKTNKSNTMNTPNSKNNYWLFTLSPRPARNTQAPQRRAPGLLKYFMDKRVGSKHFHTCHGSWGLACVTNACDQLFWPLNILVNLARVAEGLVCCDWAWRESK